MSLVIERLRPEEDSSRQPKVVEPSLAPGYQPDIQNPPDDENIPLLKKIQYSLITIAGQITALVELIDAPISTESRSAQAKLIMAKNPIIEQVGFINPIARPNPKFMMMGNELSAIGTLAAGAWLINKTNQSKVIFFTSGLRQLVEIEQRDQLLYLTLPKSIIKLIDKRKRVVKLRGIIFRLICGLRNSKKLKPLEEAWLEKQAQTSPATGIIFYDQQTIQPVVFVKATQSLVWESACGSGSVALYALTGEKLFKQPSGATLQIIAQDDKLQVIINSKDILYEN